MSSDRWMLLCRLLTLMVIPSVALEPVNADTLEEVRKRGELVCGVSEGLAGFASADDRGVWSGLDVDICKAVAAATLGDPGKVRYRALLASEQFEALKSGEVDVLSRGVDWTMAVETLHGLRFVAVSFFDGRGLLARREMGITSALELSGTRICASTGTAAEIQVLDWFTSRKMPVEILPFDRADDALAAYAELRCDVYSDFLSRLPALRGKLADPDEHMILPEAISKEPLGPVVRQGDERWQLLVQWTLFAMINAEELGLSSRNADAWLGSESPAVRQLLGVDGNFGTWLGLDEKWAYRVIKSIGNYAEIYDRNLGAESPLGLARGFNDLWSNGGLMFAPSLR